jgi:hypothetical protein
MPRFEIQLPDHLRLLLDDVVPHPMTPPSRAETYPFFDLASNFVTLVLSLLHCHYNG